MTEARRKTLLRMRQLVAKTAAVAALSTQALGCDPMPPPADHPHPEPAAPDDAAPTAPASDGGK